jgi:hypothetical protein
LKEVAMHRALTVPGVVLAANAFGAFCAAFAPAWGAEAQGTSPASPVGGVPVVDPIDVPPERDPLAHAWDEPETRGGFYLRAGFGLGFQSSRLGPAPWENDSYGTRARGFATDFSLDIGGMVNERIALHLDTHLSALWSADIHQDFAVAGDDLGSARILAYGAGPAATFFSRRNFFFRVGAGIGFAQVRWPGHSDTTNPGFFLDAMVGKEVFRDDHSAVAVEMQFVYMRLGDEDRTDEVRVRALTWGASYAFDGI